MPTAELLTLILSIVAIVLAIVAIVFEVAFFALQRNEARLLTKSVYDLVSQAIRSEKGIDQVSDQLIPLMDRLAQYAVSADRAQAAPEVEKVVSELLAPVQETITELDRRVKAGAQSEGLKREMDEKLDGLRRQISEVAEQAGKRASRRPPLVRSRGAATFTGEAAQSLIGALRVFRGTPVDVAQLAILDPPDGIAGGKGNLLASIQLARSLNLLSEIPGGKITLTPKGFRAVEQIEAALDEGAKARYLQQIDFDSDSQVIYVDARDFG